MGKLVAPLLPTNNEYDVFLCLLLTFVRDGLVLEQLGISEEAG